MSTAFGITSLSPRQAPRLPAAGLQQNNSWRPTTAPWRLLQRWAERRTQRHALLDLADQKHLLADIGHASPGGARSRKTILAGVT